MMSRARLLIIFMLVSMARSDDIDQGLKGTVLVKALREATNSTNGDSLNLPANASSIRENITDTFSCENKTYGYYADVDNDCQIFHVCLPSQTPSGRNVTYRWSFICPNETIFNQEVLTCTRPKDSIPCEESPAYYHLNDEIGKVNKTEEKPKDMKRKTQKRNQNKRKENIIMESFVNDIVQDALKDKLEEIEFGGKSVEESPMLLEAVIEKVTEENNQEEEVKEIEAEVKAEETREDEDMDRIVMERNMRNVRQMRRGNFRFRSDV